MDDKTYLALAFYCFTTLENPHDVIKKHQSFFEGKDSSGRIYISEEGINAQMSGTFEVVQSYRAFVLEDPRLASARFNEQKCKEHVFPRMTVKYRKQLAALDAEVDVKMTCTHLPPKEWKEMLEKSQDKFLIDVRNDYEWKIGHFEGAELPPLSKFRDFPAYAEELKEKLDPKTRIMMYCTGGIRCELFSALLKQKGFEEVYQLEGGILNYGEKEGAHYKGKVFVFDDRMAVPMPDAETISMCHHCGLPSDVYYNCANMDCNELFLCCDSCHEVYLACCSFGCRDSGTRRPYDKTNGNKPFRRKHLIKNMVSCASEVTDQVE